MATFGFVAIDARLVWIDDAYTFVGENQPSRLAELIAGFVREPATAQPT